MAGRNKDLEQILRTLFSLPGLAFYILACLGTSGIIRRGLNPGQERNVVRLLPVHVQ
jgi:hypothetical protein